jgi:hypothetical protein
MQAVTCAIRTIRQVITAASARGVLHRQQPITLLQKLRRRSRPGCPRPRSPCRGFGARPAGTKASGTCSQLALTAVSCGAKLRSTTATSAGVTATPTSHLRKSSAIVALLPARRRRGWPRTGRSRTAAGRRPCATGAGLALQAPALREPILHAQRLQPSHGRVCRLDAT